MPTKKSVNAKRPAATDQKDWLKALKNACKGALPWLHKLVTKAGYSADVTKLTALEVGRFFGLTSQGVGQQHKNMGCPRNRNGTYNLHDVVEWKIARDIKTQVDKRVVAAGGDPDMIGDEKDSPALEKYREVKTVREQFELDIKMKKYFRRDEVVRLWSDLGQHLGDIIQELEKKNMTDAADHVRDAISAFDFELPTEEEIKSQGELF